MRPSTSVLARAVSRPRRRRNSAARAVRYIGLFAWFGGTALHLAGEGAARDGGRRLAEEAARRWSAVRAAAVAAHVAGSAALGWAGRHRGWAQRAMPTAMILDTASTAVGIGGQWVAQGLSGASPGVPGGTPALRAARWAVLVGAGGSVLAQGYLAEQQRTVRSVRKARLRPRGRGGGGHRPALPLAHALRDLGLAASFGSAVMHALAVHEAADDVTDPLERLRALDAVADRWRPFGVAAAVAAVVGDVAMDRSRRGHRTLRPGLGRFVVAQRGIALLSVTSSVAAVAQRKRVLRSVPPGEAGVWGPAAPAPLEAAHRRLRKLERVAASLLVPVVVLDARVAEELRPVATLEGVVARLRS
ncbi:MAG TPA: hypothetical protein VM324_14010 [Egibacteraceae bacterium]|nr:hypothetical protein [Egibacteraceae bacterium]